MIIKIIKTALTIIGIPGGALLIAIAYTTSFDPSWLGSALALFGLAVSGGCGLYLVVTLMNNINK